MLEAAADPLVSSRDQEVSALEITSGSEVRQLDERSFLRRVLVTMGPGLMVCLADTDGSCLITAADSGARWNYKLLLLQGVMVPTLYFAQELAVRLALIRGKGITALVRQEAGSMWAWAVAIPLLLDCFLALISEINVFGQTILVCWGIPLFVTNTLFTASLLCLALTGSYSIAEKVGLGMGVLQVFFFGTMFMNHPDGAEVWNDLWSFPLHESNFMKLVTANIGAVIMPWMLAYQQSALCEKGLANEQGSDHLLIERIDTAVGSLLTQGVMAAMLITVAASRKFSTVRIDSVSQLLDVYTSTLGSSMRAKVALTSAICGACIVAAIVVTLCGAWALEEALGRLNSSSAERDMDLRRRVQGGSVRSAIVEAVMRNAHERPAFYSAYAGTCGVAWFVTVALPDFADDLTGVWTQFINGLLMPPIVFALWYLASYKLPEEHKLGPHLKWSLFVMFGICSAFCFVSIPFAIQDTMQHQK